MVEASTSMRMRSLMVTPTPMRPISSIMVVTSCRCGTFPTVMGVSASRVAAMIGRVAFLAPEMRISPSSLRPPLMSNLSKGVPYSLLIYEWSARLAFRRGEGAQAQGMDLAPHALPQGGVDHLVAGQRTLALELGRDHQRLEMGVVFTAHLDVC